MTNTTHTVVIFPGAGSFGSEFRPLLKAFRPNARLLRYDWRNAASGGGENRTFDQAARACAQQVRRIASGPPILLGHSFGAYVAYATAATLQQTGFAPSRAVLIAAAAPHLLAHEKQPKTRSEIEAYWRRLERGRFDQIPGQSWEDVVVETTRCDLTLFERFADSSFGRLQVPVLTAAGRDDPLLAVRQCEGWAEWTEGPHRHRTFAGGHSDFLGDSDFIDWIDAATKRTKESHHVSG